MFAKSWIRKAIFAGICTLLAAVIALPLAKAAPPPQASTTRPISDFVSTQGTFCFDPGGTGTCLLFVPPVQNFIGWTDPNSCRDAAVDYAGLANQYIESASGGAMSLGTTTSGTIVETPMPDGRARVRVTLHTTNALCWAIDCDCSAGLSCNPGPSNPTIFGHRAPEVLDGAAPALGDSLFIVDLINNAPGAPLPDLIQAFVAPLPGQQVLGLKIIASAQGELTDAYAPGAAGMPATLQVTQIGPYAPGQGVPGQDGFPAEHVIVQPLN